MADMITAAELRRFKARHPGRTVVCYVNSTAEVKAESDICCTSSNAQKVVESVPRDKGILFVPDKYLGGYVQDKTGRDFVCWQGYCPTHARLTRDMVLSARARHPRARVLVKRCLGELGWSYRVANGVLQIPQHRLEISFSALPALRNVTCHLAFDRADDRPHTAEMLRQKLDTALTGQKLLPSLAGSCLMILGVGMVILPLWMMTRHSEAIAEVVNRLLLT